MAWWVQRDRLRAASPWAPPAPAVTLTTDASDIGTGYVPIITRSPRRGKMATFHDKSSHQRKGTNGHSSRTAGGAIADEDRDKRPVRQLVSGSDHQQFGLHTFHLLADSGITLYSTSQVIFFSVVFSTQFDLKSKPEYNQLPEYITAHQLHILTYLPFSASREVSLCIPPLR